MPEKARIGAKIAREGLQPHDFAQKSGGQEGGQHEKKGTQYKIRGRFRNKQEIRGGQINLHFKTQQQ